MSVLPYDRTLWASSAHRGKDTLGVSLVCSGNSFIGSRRRSRARIRMRKKENRKKTAEKGGKRDETIDKDGCGVEQLEAQP